MDKSTPYVYLFLFIVFMFFAWSSGNESGQQSGYSEGYDLAESDLSDKLATAEENLQNAQDCISEINDQLSDAESQVLSISNDLSWSLDGDYYDLYDAADSASSDLNAINFYSRCN